ncbi:MAG: ATP-dependent helicase [Candidatus Krumholzibacteriia bacterium]
MRSRLRRTGYHVVAGARLVAAATAARGSGGAGRTSLRNPASRWLKTFADHPKIAVLDLRCRSLDDLRIIHGYLVEPAFRRSCALLIHADRRLEDLDPAVFVDPEWRYPWTLERLHFLCGRFAEASGRRPAAVNRWRRLIPWLTPFGHGRAGPRAVTLDPTPPAGRAGLVRPGLPAPPLPAPPTPPTPPPPLPPLPPLPLPPMLARLDPAQLAAVRAGDGVVQVIAPAGSGKTTVLVERTRELIRRGTAPDRILCASFNRDAKTEIETRLAREGLAGVQVSSFHGMGLRILRRERRLRGRIGGPGVAQWKRLAREAMLAEPDGVWFDPAAAQNLISSFKLVAMITAEQAFARSRGRGPRERTAARLYSLHEHWLQQQGMLDFDDLIARAVTLLQGDSRLRQRWQASFERVLVDEYQDIEPAQALLVGILAAPQDSLFCVGDEDQCIYAWRRASVRRVVELDQVYPGLERYPLVRNYRCGKRITLASRRLIGHNRCRFRKPLRPGASQCGAIVVHPVSAGAAGRTIATDLLRNLARDEAVVIARTSVLLREVALTCARRGIGFAAAEKVVRCPPPVAIVGAYLRLLSRPRRADAADVERVFRAPNRYLPYGAAPEVAERLRAGASFAGAVADLPVESWQRQPLAEAGALLDALSSESGAECLIARLRGEGGLDRFHATRERLDATECVEIETLDRMQAAARGYTAARFATVLDAGSELLRSHCRDDGVELTTVHGAKGREWDHVILYGADQGQFPHARSVADSGDPVEPDGRDGGEPGDSTGGDLGDLGDRGEPGAPREPGEPRDLDADPLEDERRLFYVAMTRARLRLDIVCSAVAPSQFLAEAGLRVPRLSGRGRGCGRGRGRGCGSDRVRDRRRL